MVRDARPLSRISSRCNSLIRCSPAASASATRISACATRDWLEGVERWFWERARTCRSNKTAPPMFAPFKLREMAAREPHHRLADGDVFGGRRHAQRLPLRPLRRARAGRRRPGLHRDDLRLARRPDQPRLHRHVERRACRRVEADRRFRPRQSARRRSASSSAIRAPRARPRFGWEGNDVPLDDGNWPVMAASDVPWSPVNQVPTRDDPRRHGRGARPVRRRRRAWGSRPASTWSSSTPPTAICCRASSPRCRTSAPTNMAAASKTACAIRSKCSRRCAPPGRRTGRCRCASRPTTGPATTASRPTKRSRSPKPSRAKAPT